MNIEKAIFQRTQLLLGTERMSFLQNKNVIILGIGGVGSWCAESLIRTGIKHLTIVDSDLISITNINRQLHATSKTIGKIKVEVLKERLQEINPHAEIVAIQSVYNNETQSSFGLENYDYIIDAIDSLSYKIDLIRNATKTNAYFVSSLGASLKLDPSKIKIADFWEVRGCPFGALIRKRIRRGELPAKTFLCVYSDEVLENIGTIDSTDFENFSAENEITYTKAVTNGSLVHITAIFGFTLAGLIIKHIYEQFLNSENKQ